MSPESQTDFGTENIRAIAAYLSSGDKACACRLGLELEQFVMTDAGASVPYSGPGGIEQLLGELRGNYEAEIREGVRLLGLARPGTTLTLEPGAQVEISTGPFCRIHQLEESYLRFQSEIDAVLAGRGQHLLPCGYRPDLRADEVELIPKDRYRFMDAHFRKTGAHGRQMMRGSAATQISIDYTGEDDAVLKARVATLIGPLLALATDTTTHYEGLPSSGHMIRTMIWNDVDAARCNTVSGLFERDFSFSTYARALYEAPLVVVPRGDGSYDDCDGRSAAELYADRLMSRAEIEHLLSLFFFDVRWKNYVEIRMADSMPIALALSLTALIKGIFYDRAQLAELAGALKFAERSAADVVAAKDALRAEGYKGLAYGVAASAWLDLLVELAQRGLPADEQHYLAPLADLIAERQSPRDRVKGKA
ncbi:MAG: glutamate-cysteine ligase family protein [Actinomycetia bacterium]|nr:glutamate-cysteine ligase family protein [Actinomycetes bacterium]